MTKTYKNIPVDNEETYEAVKAIAESNGFGKRGMGRQIEAWVAQTLAAPICDHPKTPVQVQWMPTDTMSLGEPNLLHNAWYCTTCKRVYRQSAPIKISRPVVEETPTGNAQDPYGQPAPVVEKRRKASAREVSA
jgi:hypothetical protein